MPKNALPPSSGSRQTRRWWDFDRFGGSSGGSSYVAPVKTSDWLDCGNTFLRTKSRMRTLRVSKPVPSWPENSLNASWTLFDAIPATLFATKWDENSKKSCCIIVEICIAHFSYMDWVEEKCYAVSEEVLKAFTWNACNWTLNTIYLQTKYQHDRRFMSKCACSFMQI